MSGTTTRPRPTRWRRRSNGCAASSRTRKSRSSSGPGASSLSTGSNSRLTTSAGSAVETPYFGWPLDLEAQLFRLHTAGFTPVLAHPERNAEVQADPTGRLAPLVRSGTLVQLTAASIDGRLGRKPRAASARILELELAHLIASDAHAPTIRAVGMKAAAEAVGDDALARWLTWDVPAAMLAGTEIPERPLRKRRWLRR
jgi:protein-tyrosine phosphatase